MLRRRGNCCTALVRFWHIASNRCNAQTWQLSEVPLGSRRRAFRKPTGEFFDWGLATPFFLGHGLITRRVRWSDRWAWSRASADRETRHCVGEAMAAMETAQERWCEAEVNRIAGAIALLSQDPDATDAEAYFTRALAVARQQQAKSWELRATMSMARLWCDQGKWKEARNLLAPVYGCFSEGFDTRDLKEAKVLLDALTP